VRSTSGLAAASASSNPVNGTMFPAATSYFVPLLLFWSTWKDHEVAVSRHGDSIKA
jgi:hypothetical protein